MRAILRVEWLFIAIGLMATPLARAADAAYQMEPTTASSGTELLNEATLGTKQFEFGGYFRSGTGWNQGGGRQTCFTNPGSKANEFRLGNECSTYGEAALRTHILKGSGATDPFFNAITTLAYNPNADTQYEATGGFAGGASLNLIEAYVEGGNFDELGLTFWAGKRFYRTVDEHMGDFYYFANMSGNGAGIGNFKTGYGVWRAALLQETATTSTAGVVTHTDTNTAGDLSKTAFDLRLDNMKLSDKDTLFGWFVAATTPPGTDGGGHRYVQAHGYVGGLRYNRKVGGNLLTDADPKRTGSNDLAVMVGTGVMESLEMNGGTQVPESDQHERDAMRIRVVEHATLPLTARLATHAEAVYENRHRVTSTTSATGAAGSGYWWDVGVRPVYAFTEHYSLAFEMGHSEVKDDSETVGVRQVTRFTLAPQVSISNHIFGRPVIRAYLTHTRWNDANRTQLVAGSQEYQNSNSGTSVGFQTEVWF